MSKYYKIEVYEVYDRFPQRSDTKYVKDVNFMYDAVKKAFKNQTFLRIKSSEYQYATRDKQIFLKIKEIKFI